MSSKYPPSPDWETRVNHQRKCLLLVACLLPAMAMDMECAQGPGGGQPCTEIAVPSLVLAIRDANGAPLQRATVLYRRTIGLSEPQTVICEGNCDDFEVVYELTGRIDYSVIAGGYVTVNGSVNVPLDAAGCHPVSQGRAVSMERDLTAGALSGAWTSTNFAGQTNILRFGPGGAPIGAILTNRVNTGDTNVYVAFNGNQIAGVPNRTIEQASAPNATRSGNVVDWSATAAGYVIGFENATLTSDQNGLTGMLLGSSVQYTRLEEVPAPLETP
jgi:hypothetical protein